MILEDTDQDGRADKSTIFADNLHVPLSFELGDGGVYVSEQPELTFLKDTDGDDRADQRTTIFSGFGTEDSHHALHDFVWSPDGDLIFRESIFHHTQVETPYGPVRQQNSGWFRYTKPDESTLLRGMQAMVKAQCQQCHVVAGHGYNLGPDLTESVKKNQGLKLLQQILEPSHEIHPQHQSYQFLLSSGAIVSGVIVNEDEHEVQVAANLLAPQAITKLAKADIEERVATKVSAMPQGLVDVLTKQEILDLLAYLESAPANVMQHGAHDHGH